MAVSTKLLIIDNKVNQNGVLTLCGCVQIDSVGRLTYLTNQTSSYGELSVPHVGYVTGITSGFLNCINTCFYNKNEINNYTGNTNIRISNLESISITGATNGISKFNGNNVCLGGNITDLVVFTDTRAIPLGLQYGDDYTPHFTTRSIPDVGYVTGLTNSIVTDLENYYTKNEINSYTGDTDVRLNIVEEITNVAITGASNGLFKTDAHNIELGGSLTKNTVISGSYGFCLNVNTIKLTGLTGSVEIGGNGLFLSADIPGTGGLLCLGDAGEVCQTSLAAFGGITGATNGIVDYGNQMVGLGGTLCSETIICGNDENIAFGTISSRLCSFNIHTQYGHTITAPDGYICINVCGGEICTSDLMGLRYATDYSDTFVANSLISKQYADSIVSGLDPKSAVRVASTENITLLSDIQTVDGILLIGGDRILVKNQDNKTDNGIYVVGDGNWIRADDFDGNPTGEVTQGALIPVLTGNTNVNTLWILITDDPIIVGTNDLVFTKFSQLIDVSNGGGISISTIGAVRTIGVDLDDNSGLCFSNSKLKIDNCIAGGGLCWNNGVIDVDVPTDGTTGISVKRDASDCLIVETSEINIALGGVLTGSTNGLTDSNGIVCLGGQLVNSTIICGNDTCGLTYQDTAITNKRGIQYANDYSNTYVARSLVDAAFVTGLTSTSGIQTANNGLTKYGTNVVLGGTLTGDTTICGDCYSLNITEPKIFNLKTNCVNITPTYASVCLYSSGVVIGGSGIVCGTGGIVIGGVTYMEDPTSGAYGDASISINGGIACGVRSIAIGNNACWGSKAYGSNSIAIGGNNRVDSNFGTIIGGDENRICSGNDYSIILGGYGVNIPEDDYKRTAIVQNLAIWNIPSNGLETDSVLVWNSTDKKVKTVSGSAFGDSNNNYFISGISSNTIFSDDNDVYLIAVDTTSNSICVTLPSTVSNGRVFKIKDVSGNALTNNVVICSDNGTHTFDGDDNALINTDYGSLKLIYSDVMGICGWFALSYMN